MKIIAILKIDLSCLCPLGLFPFTNEDLTEVWISLISSAHVSRVHYSFIMGCVRKRYWSTELSSRSVVIHVDLFA